MLRQSQDINTQEKILQGIETGFFQDVMYPMSPSKVPHKQIKQEELILKQQVYVERQNGKQQQVVSETNVIQIKVQKNQKEHSKQHHTTTPPKPIQTNIVIKHSQNNGPIELETEVYYDLNFQWRKGNARIENNIFKLPTASIQLSQIRKVKVFKDVSINYTLKIKLSLLAEDFAFFVEPKATIQNMPLQYFWFSKIITMKLTLKQFDLKHTFLLKKQFTNKNIKNPIIEGMIYKKSQYWGTWELRYGAITQEGFFSYKDQSSQQSFHIKRGTLQQLWTRFDIHQKLLVVKVLHSGRKTELAIPFARYCEVSNINWLYPLYELIHQ